MNGKDWLGKFVRVHSGPDWDMEHAPMVEGEVVYYIDGPSIGVRDAGGDITAWPVSLPIATADQCADPSATGDYTSCEWGRRSIWWPERLTHDEVIERLRGMAREANRQADEIRGALYGDQITVTWGRW